VHGPKFTEAQRSRAEGILKRTSRSFFFFEGAAKRHYLKLATGKSNGLRRHFLKKRDEAQTRLAGSTTARRRRRRESSPPANDQRSMNAHTHICTVFTDAETIFTGTYNRTLISEKPLPSLLLSSDGGGRSRAR
jgi:hypothetical protein